MSIEELGGIVLDHGSQHLQVYVIDGVAHLSEGDGDFDLVLNASELRRLANMLRNAERRVS